ncbi:MAG: hypothetical protein WC979_00360 [Candidatus Pacearchaeota archaeon]|jgi:hypothetical protein|nr:hypothetical protein [Clostridia bacterium]
MKTHKENNELIARFVGAKVVTCKDSICLKWVFVDNLNPFVKLFDNRIIHQELHFHDDWNWTMQLVQYILTHSNKECDAKNPEPANFWRAVKFRTDYANAIVKDNCTIEQVYNICITYIKNPHKKE